MFNQDFATWKMEKAQKFARGDDAFSLAFNELRARITWGDIAKEFEARLDYSGPIWRNNEKPGTADL